MSEMVRYTGKIAPVGKLPNETLEEQCKRILAEHNYFELNGYCDSWREMLNEELHERYVVACGEVYKVIEKNYKAIDDDIFNARDNGDGTIDYEVMYYNGGCSLDEAIEYALEEVDF